MKKLYSLLALCLFAVAAHAQTVYPDYVDGQIYFKIKKETRIFRSLDGNYTNLPVSSIPLLEKIAKAAGITRIEQPFVHAKKSPDLRRIFRITFTNATAVETIIQQIAATGQVEYAEKVPLTKTTLTVNDPSYGSQWGLTTINAPLAWNYYSTGSNIVVAIVDDAVERTHPDLSANLWVNPGDATVNGVDDDGNGYIDDVNGWDVADNDNNPNPPTTAFDHGTHVAGIAGARSNNTTGVASIGFSVKLMCIKSTNSATSVTNGYDGVLYAADNGANVINMSWGGTGTSATTLAIIDYAFAQGCVLIAAAGNDDVSTMFYPAAYTNVIAVAATTSSDTKASFSNYGSWVDISAPGFNIYSTIVGASYGNKSGTSMASPMVAGLAGLMLSLNPSLTNVDIRNCLTSTADNIDLINPGYGGMLGAGRIDAEAAMNCISATLAWPPSANFVANVTTITAGGSVNFTDLSVYSPTSWTWSFPGGTPSSYSGANPPPIVYNTPGTYNVQLSATNANGTDVELKTSYITVNADGGCGQLNYPIPAGWNLVNYYTGATFASDGWINGVNIYADRQKAAYFDASSTPYTTLNNVWIAFGLAWCNNPADIVPIKIYDGTSGSPGSLLGTTNLTMGQIMSDVSGGYYTEANFITNPVTLPASKRFFVAVDLTNLSWTGVKDTLSIVSNTNGETVPSAIWEQQSDLLWYQYNTAGSWSLNASLVIHPWLTSTPTNATFTNSTLTICEDNSVSFDAAGSTYEDTLLWYFPGGSPDLSNNLTETVMYNTPGTYLATLYIVGGGCSLLDSMYVTVTVNAKPAVSVSASAGEICPSGSSTLTASGATSYTWSPTTGLSSGTGTPVTATPASTTTYTVTGTNAAGCQNSAVIEIEVLDPPTASATVGSTLCSGAPVTFDGSLSADATSFAWTLTGGSPSSSTATGGTVTYATAGTYNVELQVTNICGTDTDIVPITVNASPTASFNFSVDTVCTTNGLVSMSGTPSGGVFSGSAVTGSDFDPAAAGAGNFTITYTYTDANSCVDSTSDNIVVEICSGIAEALNSGGVAVFPNPASTVLNILGKTNFDRIQMSDATGRIVARTQFAPTNTQTIDLNNLPNGVYNLQLMSETNVVYSNRIVVSK